MKYLITERQYRLLLEENIYPTEEEYRQAEEKRKRTIDLTDQYKSGNITHEAKPGDVIKIGHQWIYGEVYLTQGNDVGYHGGFIRDLNEFMDKRKGLYLTKSLESAWRWPGVAMRQNYRRVYEVKIKSGSLFIDSSPAGQDEGSAHGLEDEHNALIPMGIEGMADENFRYDKHTEGEGTTGSEALILNVSAIESFRAIPFSELIKNENLKSNSPRAFEKFSNWYYKLKDKVMEKYFFDELQNARTSFDEYLKNNPNKSYVDFLMSTDTKLENFKKSISQQLEDIIDSLSDDELKNLVSVSWA